MVCLFVMLKRTHPLMFMACIALVSLIISLLIRVYRNVVLGGLVILIYVGGVIVPFSYRVCLAPNPNFIKQRDSTTLVNFIFRAGLLVLLLVGYFFAQYYFFSGRTFLTDFSLAKGYQYDSSIFFSDG